MIQEQYIKRGRVRLIHRHYAFLGPESTRAAEAVECSADQGEFATYSHLLLNNQASKFNTGGFSDERLVAFARFAGLDEELFEACLVEDRYLANVDRDYDDAIALGVRGTPSVFINGEFVTPADLPTVTAALDRTLAALGAD